MNIKNLRNEDVSRLKRENVELIEELEIEGVGFIFDGERFIVIQLHDIK